jgi:predicted RNA binding protein YcfA (HicA-like mRNA interferase family)
VSTFEKLLEKLLRGGTATSFSFTDLCYILRCAGFDETIKGSHHIFSRSGVEEQMNLQKWHGSKDAKPYQVRQVRNLLLKYDLGRER